MALISGLIIYFLPVWWLIALIPMAVSMIFIRNAGQAFAAGFLSIFLLWLAFNIWRMSLANSAYVDSISELLMMPGGSTGLMFLSSFIGGIIGGFGALTGTLFVQLFVDNKRR